MTRTTTQLNSLNLTDAVKGILIDEFRGLTQSEASKWIDDLENHGCRSGMVGSLIYYTDTNGFFDDLEDEILDLAKEYDFRPDVVELGITGFKNQMAWFAFEALARPVFEELEVFEDEHT